MNIKSNKGLSMIAVVIVLAVIIATIVETIIIARKWTQNEAVEDLATTMLLIQARSKTYSDKETMKENEDKKNKAELKGTPIKEINDNKEINSLIEKEIIKKDDKFYLLSNRDLEELHVYDVEESDVFLVNYETEEVIYANGIEKDGNTVYKLSDIRQNTEEEQNNVANEAKETKEENNEEKK